MIKTIGILGFGVVGKSALAFIRNKEKELYKHLFSDCHPELACLAEATKGEGWDSGSNHFGEDGGTIVPFVWDEKMVSEQEMDLLAEQGASFVLAGQIKLKTFVTMHDYVLVSPGVDTREYDLDDQKILCELDLFSAFFKKPTIAITGTLGKTTTTKLLAKILGAVTYHENSFIKVADEDYGVTIAEGGNVGVGMLDLIDREEFIDCAVIELSSFQLERSKTFAPDIAIMTNFFDNHLERHGESTNYFEAKWRMFQYQREGQVTIVPLNLAQKSVHKQLQALRSHFCLVSPEAFNETMLSYCHSEEAQDLSPHKQRPFAILTNDPAGIYLREVQNKQVVKTIKLFDAQALPDVTFFENWLMILAALYYARVDFSSLKAVLEKPLLLDDHHHRLEHFTTINGVDFYNDSKSTVIQSTEAAVKKLAQSNRPIILILGGKGKGVDRSPLMTILADIKNIKKVYCFGKECSDFKGCETYDSLETVVDAVFKVMQPGDQVLFSPSGNSYDLFEHYKQRGDVFKKLVREKNNKQ